MNEIERFHGRDVIPPDQAAHRRGLNVFSDLGGGHARPGPFPPEPPIDSVIKYQLTLGGKLFTYVSLRAGNGLWYTTGGGTKQNATWAELVAAIDSSLAGPVTLLGYAPAGVILWRS